MRSAAGVNGIKEKGKDTNKKKNYRRGVDAGSISTARGAREQKPPAPRPAQPVNSSLRGCPAPGGGSADRQKFAAGVPGGARRAG